LRFAQPLDLHYELVNLFRNIHVGGHWRALIESWTTPDPGCVSELAVTCSHAARDFGSRDTQHNMLRLILRNHMLLALVRGPD
jgi:hypothetical protein